VFEVIQGHSIQCSIEPVHDFLLEINCNLGPISHRYWDIATYWPEITNFSYPLSFSTLVRGDPLQIYEQALFLASDGKDLVILAFIIFDCPPMWQTDGWIELRWLRRATAVAAFTCKNYNYVEILAVLETASTNNRKITILLLCTEQSTRERELQ